MLHLVRVLSRSRNKEKKQELQEKLNMSSMSRTLKKKSKYGNKREKSCKRDLQEGGQRIPDVFQR